MARGKGKRDARQLPPELWSLVLSRLPAGGDRTNAACSCSAIAEASLQMRAKIAVDVIARETVPRRLGPALREVLLLCGADLSQLPNTLASLDEESTDLVAVHQRRVGHIAATLRRLVKVRHAACAGATPRPLSLTLAIPGLLLEARKLERLLEAVGGSKMFAEVRLARGLAALDGALQAQLTRVNVLGAALTPWLKAGAYRQLSSVTAKVQSSEELLDLLGAVSAASLPLLRTLVLVAPPGAAVRAGFAALRHTGIQQLALQGVEIEGGFEGLAQLEGLQSLSLCYEEEEGPEVNLDGNLHLLSSLQQLRRLRVTSLACDEGLLSLTTLTSLSIAPGSDTYIVVERLPKLQHLAVDLTAECRGMELLQRGCVAFIPKGHGLCSLSHLEVRCLVWDPEEMEAAAGGDSWQGSGDSAALFSAGSNLWGGEGGEGDSDGGNSELGWQAGGGQGGVVAGQPWGEQEGSEAEAGGEDVGSMGSNSDVDEDDDEEEADGGNSEAGDSSDEEASEQQDEEEEDEDEDIAASDSDAGDQGNDDGSEQAGEEERPEQEEDGEEAAGAAYAVATPWQAKEGAEQDAAKALALLEGRYIAGLVRRVPTLTSILLSDYLGPVPSPAAHATLPDRVLTRSAAVKAAAAAAAASAATVVGGSAASRAEGVAPTEGGKRVSATLCEIAGTAWTRCICETPVPGGISQYDLRFTRLL